MSDVVIKIPSKIHLLRHPKLADLKGKKIGPVFPPDPDRELGMRGVESKDTKNHNWPEYRARRNRRNKIAKGSRRKNAKR